MSDAFDDLLARLIAETQARHPYRPPLIGVAGAQGSGKSTRCAAFAARSGGGIAHFSLDDVYLTRAMRQHLIKTKHPLLGTRGPPGTHDLGLAEDVINALTAAGAGAKTLLPSFDKMADDRAPMSAWPVFEGAPEAILVDGWCLGARPFEAHDYASPINQLEELDDMNGRWRRHTLGKLDTSYRDFFAAFDEIIFLQAPSFEIVRAWRGQQQEAMLGRAMQPAERSALDRFIAHYERITRAMIEGRHGASWVVRLDQNRSILGVEEAR